MHTAPLHICATSALSLTGCAEIAWLISRHFQGEPYSTCLFEYTSSQGKLSVKFNAEAITQDLPTSFKLKVSILALAKIKLPFSNFSKINIVQERTTAVFASSYIRTTFLLLEINVLLEHPNFPLTFKKAA